MTFAQFYDHGLDGKLAPVIGDRGVVILDGRLSLSNLVAEGKSCNGVRRPRYEAMALCKGSFSCFDYLTPILRLN